MKKVNLITALLLALVFVFTACEAVNNESGDLQSSILQESELRESDSEASQPETSDETSHTYREDVTLGIVVEGDVYTQEQLDEWVETFVNGAKQAPSKYGDNSKYNVTFFPERDTIIEQRFAEQYLTSEKLDEYENLFKGTEAFNLAELLEYYGISWDEYIGFYVGTEYDRIMSLGTYAGNLGTGESKDDFPPYAAYHHLFNSGWAEEKFWKHEDFYLEGYEPGEFEDYCTYIPVEERGGLMRRAYIIDGRYIEKIGREAFNEWLDKTEDKDQTIWNFIYEFGYVENLYKPDAPEKYVDWGTDEESRKLYFTVHPLNKEE